MTIQHTELKLRDILLLESAKSQCRPRPVGDLSQKASVFPTASRQCHFVGNIAAV